MTHYDALEVHVELDGATVLAGRAQSAALGRKLPCSMKTGAS